MNQCQGAAAADSRNVSCLMSRPPCSPAHLLAAQEVLGGGSVRHGLSLHQPHDQPLDGLYALTADPLIHHNSKHLCQVWVVVAAGDGNLIMGGAIRAGTWQEQLDGNRLTPVHACRHHAVIAGQIVLDSAVLAAAMKDTTSNQQMMGAHVSIILMQLLTAGRHGFVYSGMPYCVAACSGACYVCSVCSCTQASQRCLGTPTAIVCTECCRKPTFKNFPRCPLAEFRAQGNVCNSHGRQACQGWHTCSGWVASEGAPSQTWQRTWWRQQQRTVHGTKEHHNMAVRV